MSEIALYNAFTKLGLTHDEAKEAVADVASTKDVATKADMSEVKGELKTDIANLETRLTNRIYAVAGIIIGAVGLMIKFL